jgi:hypothetical protein
MEVKKGTPTAKVSIWTDDAKIVATAVIGGSDSEVIQITTQKDLENPAGSFSITFVPRLDKDGKSWFDKLDAFDYVEIEFFGIGDTENVTVMRGLIDVVNKSESWEGGVPQRQITVSGRDLGSIFTDHQIYFMPELSQIKAAEAMNIGVILWKGIQNFEVCVNCAEAFMTILGRVQEGLDLTFGGGQIVLQSGIGPLFNYKAATTFKNDLTSYNHLMSYQGDFWNALAYFQDKPFHEMFLYDHKLGSRIILRPSRLKDVIGHYHVSVTENDDDEEMYPPDFTFSDLDLVSINVSKKHAEIYNYYLTFPSCMGLQKVDMRGIFLDSFGGDPSATINPFFQNDKTLPAFIGKYGFRKLEASTVFIKDDIKLTEPGQQNTRGQNFGGLVKKSFIERGIERNKMLVAWFLHNEYLFDGSIDIPGTNKAIIGTYVKNTSDNMEYYVEGVTHTFVRFQSFRTTLRVSRGMPKDGLGMDKNCFLFSSTGVFGERGDPQVIREQLEAKERKAVEAGRFSLGKQ